MPDDVLYAQVNGQFLLVQGFGSGKFSRAVFTQAFDVMLPGLDRRFRGLLALAG
jgi:hypothetical protein